MAFSSPLVPENSSSFLTIWQGSQDISFKFKLTFLNCSFFIIFQGGPICSSLLSTDPPCCSSQHRGWGFHLLLCFHLSCHSLCGLSILCYIEAIQTVLLQEKLLYQ